MGKADGGVKRWLSDRTGASRVIRALEDYRLRGNQIAYYLGGIALFLLLLAVASGLLLLLPYRPHPDEAHASVIRIVGRVPFGGLVRGIHVWASHLFVGAVLIHLLSTALRRSFRAPSELLWVSGLVLLILTLGMAFTGAILPWSESAYYQARVSSEIAGHTPLIGNWLRRFLRGGTEVSGWTLQHAFGFHTGVLPAATTFLLALHLLFLRRRAKPLDSGEPSPPDPTPRIAVYPDFVVRMAAVCTGVFVLVMSLATFVELPVGEPADPLRPAPADAMPPWYLLPVHRLLSILPGELLGLHTANFIVGAIALLGVLAFLLPFIDRRGSKLTAAAALLFSVLALVLTINAIL